MARSEREKARARERAKAWREANPERYKQQQKDWYERNKDYQKAKSLHRHHRGRNPRLAAKYYQIFYRWKHKSALKEKDRQYYQENRSRIIERVSARQKRLIEERREKRIEERREVFRDFVRNLPDAHPPLPTPKRLQRQEILTALDTKVVKILSPKPTPPQLSGRPRRLWRRLSRRGLPQNDGARP